MAASLGHHACRCSATAEVLSSRIAATSTTGTIDARRKRAGKADTDTDTDRERRGDLVGTLSHFEALILANQEEYIVTIN